MRDLIIQEFKIKVTVELIINLSIIVNNNVIYLYKNYKKFYSPE